MQGICLRFYVHENRKYHRLSLNRAAQKEGKIFGPQHLINKGGGTGTKEKEQYHHGSRI